VRMIGAVGSDAFANALLAGLEADGVDVRWIARREGGSGAAMIVVDRSTGQYSILVGPGANALAELPTEDDPFVWADTVVMPLEIPLPLVLETVRRVRTAGKFVVLDPAPARADLPAHLLSCCDIVSPNESELSILSGVPGLDRLDDNAYADGVAPSVARAAAVLRERGARTVVAKLGRHGTYWDGGAFRLFRRARRIEAVDTTAAGDAFTGALAVSLAEGRRPEEALERALAAGTLTCLAPGAQPSLPRRADVEQMLKH